MRPAMLTACSNDHWYAREKLACPDCFEPNKLHFPEPGRPPAPTKMVCSKRHEYELWRKWCPKCGEPNSLMINGKKPKKTKVAFMVHNVPITVRDRYKKACEKAKTTMRNEMVKFMDEFAAKHGFPA